MKNMFPLCLILLIANSAHGSAFGQWGIGSNPGPHESRSDQKWGEIGVTGEQGKLSYTAGIGYWNDTTGYVDRKQKNIYASSAARSSWFVEMLYGAEPHSKTFYGTYKLGPAIISHPDALLGSNIQIAHELGFGIKDARGVRVGIVLKHFSNAGIVKPNLGRDFMGLRIEF